MKIIVITLTSLLAMFSCFAAPIKAQYKNFPQGEYLYSAEFVSNLVVVAEAKAASSNLNTNIRLDQLTNAITQSYSFSQASVGKTSGWDRAAEFVGSPGFSQLTNSWISAADQAAAMVLKTQFWDLAWSFAFSATPKTNEWNLAYNFYAENSGKVPQWDSAYLVALYSASRTNAWDSAANFAAAYASHTAGWDWAASLVQPFNTVSNLAVNAASLIYVDSEIAELTAAMLLGDQASRDYALGLLEASLGGLGSFRLFDLSHPATNWLEYSNGELVLAVVSPEYTTYQWYTYSDYDLVVSGAGSTINVPLDGAYLFAETLYPVNNATSFVFCASDGFYHVSNVSGGTEASFGFGKASGVVAPMFRRGAASYYSAPGVYGINRYAFPDPYITYLFSDNTVYATPKATVASGDSWAGFCNAFGLNQDGAGLNTKYVVGPEPTAQIFVTRSSTYHPAVTNRESLWASGFNFIEATNLIFAAISTAAGSTSNFVVSAAVASSNFVVATSNALTQGTSGISPETATNISLYVTGVHSNRTDNPHQVTASQVGALTPSDTNGWVVSSHPELFNLKYDVSNPSNYISKTDRIIAIDGLRFAVITNNNIVLYEVSTSEVPNPDFVKIVVAEDLYGDPELWLGAKLVDAGIYYAPVTFTGDYGFSLSTNSSDGVSWAVSGVVDNPEGSFFSQGGVTTYFISEELNGYYGYLPLISAGFVGYEYEDSFTLREATTTVFSTNAVKTFASLEDLGGFVRTNHVGDTSLTGNTRISGAVEAGLVLLSTNYVVTGTESLGTLYWDTGSLTAVVVYPNGQRLNLGEEFSIPVQNDTGTTIPDGSIVMWSGEIGNSGNARVVKAYVTPSTDVYRILGVSTTAIPPGERGKVTKIGKVRGIQTNGANVGETWANATEIYVTTNQAYAGLGTSVKPPAPYPAVRIAKVVNAHANNGTFEVDVCRPFRLVDLIDVDGTPVNTTGQFPVWDQARQVFDFTANVNTLVPSNRTITVNNNVGELSSNLVFTAWQNPAGATNWTWTSDGTQITLESYSGPGGHVPIPDTLDGLPVTTLGIAIFWDNDLEISKGVESISGGHNIARIMTDAFYYNPIEFAYLPGLRHLDDTAFLNCGIKKLEAPLLGFIGMGAFAFSGVEYVSFYSVTNISMLAFHSSALTSIELPRVKTIGGYAFQNSMQLRSVYFYGDAPSVGVDIYDGIPANQVTNYVTNPTATGWGATFGGMPVVRLPVHGTVIKLSTNYTPDGAEPVGSFFYDAGLGMSYIKGTNKIDALTLGGVTRTTWPEASPNAITNIIFAVKTNEAFVVNQSITSASKTQTIEFANGTLTRARGTNDLGYAKIYFDLNSANLSTLHNLGNEKMAWWGAAGAVESIDTAVTAGYVLKSNGAGQAPTFQADVDNYPSYTQSTNIASVVATNTFNGMMCWQTIDLPSAVNNEYVSFYGQPLQVNAASVTSAWIVVRHPCPDKHIVVRFEVFTSSAIVNTNTTYIFGGNCQFGASSTKKTNFLATIMTNAVNKTYRPQFIISTNSVDYGPQIRFDIITRGLISAGSFFICNPYWRPATAAEIAAGPVYDQ